MGRDQDQLGPDPKTTLRWFRAPRLAVHNFPTNQNASNESGLKVGFNFFIGLSLVKSQMQS